MAVDLQKLKKKASDLEAKKQLEKAGFDVEIQDSIYTDTAKAMTVLRQFPESDEVVKVNRKVFLTITRSEPPVVEMPNLVGYSLRNAEMVLKNMNIRIGLHAGPAIRTMDPVIKQLNFMGSNVSRAARIEPVTPPGQVYCSEPFAALAEAGAGPEHVVRTRMFLADAADADAVVVRPWFSFAGLHDHRLRCFGSLVGRNPRRIHHCSKGPVQGNLLLRYRRLDLGTCVLVRRAE